MFSLKLNTFLKIKLRFLLSFGILLLVFSCSKFWKKKEEGKPLARVGESYLYIEDVAPFLNKGISKEDSTTLVNGYINNWAAKQILLSKSKINLPEEKLTKFDALVDEYKTDLYTRAYKDALIQKGTDSVITNHQLNSFYETQKENFKLKERVVRLRFIELPKQFIDKDVVIQKLKDFEKEDVRYLDSVGVQFKKLNFNDSIWVTASRVIQEIAPLTFENQDKYLKKSQFFELEDSIGVYLAKIVEVKEINDVAPLSFVEPTIRQVILNRRKLAYMRQIETEVIDEAIKEKEFEVYVNDK